MVRSYMTKYTGNKFWMETIWKDKKDLRPPTLLTDLVSHWDMQGSLVAWPDSLGNNDFISVGALDPHSGATPPANLPGSTQFTEGNHNILSTVNPLNGANTGSFTISTWFQTTMNFNFQNYIFINTQNSGNGTGFSLDSHGGGGNHGVFTLVINPSNNIDVGGFVTSPQWSILAGPNPWNFVVATYNSETKDLVVSMQNTQGTSITGTKLGVNNPSGYILNSTTPAVINTQTGNFTIASMDLWNRVITSAEITALYNSGDGLAFADYVNIP